VPASGLDWPCALTAAACGDPRPRQVEDFASAIVLQTLSVLLYLRSAR
jgi:hypothetical protein